MGFRTALVLLGLLCALVWWQAMRPDDTPAPPSGPSNASAQRVASACPLPPRVARGDPPLQVGVPAGTTLPALDDARVTALAGFSVDAKVLSREDYRFGREAAVSPLDLALGWGRMSEDAVVSRLDIRQGGRWYRYRWRDQPPIPLADIIRSSANMHMIPADDAVAAALKRIERGQRVRIDGWLVEVEAKDGWRWRSSLTREDSGGGACELVYVCAVTTE